MPEEKKKRKASKRRKIPADIKGPEGREAQPVSGVVWIPRERIRANDYNPNRVFAPELRLLKISLLADGWTQPIVVRPVIELSEMQSFTEVGVAEMRINLSQNVSMGFEVVDGYHRWLAAEDAKVGAMTGGDIPCVIVIPLSPEHQKMSTVRHNRARGHHQVVDMAKIVADLSAEGFGEAAIMDLLQMEAEEVRRLLARGNMLERGSEEGFNKGWTSG